MNLVDLVGNTPLVELRRVNPNPGVRLFGKVEGNNPGSSVKDRAAKFMIEGAEKRGELKPGVRIIEPTSGNTGIALAMIAAVKGYEIELVMPASSDLRSAWPPWRLLAPKSRSRLADARMEGAIDFVREQVAKGGGAHAQPVWQSRQLARSLRDHRAGNLARHQRDNYPFRVGHGNHGNHHGNIQIPEGTESSVRIVGVQPSENARIPGIRRWPKEYLPAIFEPERVDMTLDVTQEEAEEMARRLARQEGVFAGVSSGGACAAACRLASTLDAGVIVFVLCDQGDRYLSSDLFVSSVAEGERRRGD